MKLLKRDDTYKYYELSERDQEGSCVWDADVVAIKKSDLKYMTAMEALCDGFYKNCEYDCKKDLHTVFENWVIDPDTIKIAD